MTVGTCSDGVLHRVLTAVRKSNPVMYFEIWISVTESHERRRGSAYLTPAASTIQHFGNDVWIPAIRGLRGFEKDGSLRS
jgi:hypothetical protein